jgi:hypothetical protein
MGGKKVNDLKNHILIEGILMNMTKLAQFSKVEHIGIQFL